MRWSLLAFVAYMLLFLAYSLHYWHDKVPWDICAYSLTGKYLLGADTYFEALRAPIPSLFYAIFGKLGYFVVSILLLSVSVYVFATRKGHSPLVLALLLLPAVSWQFYIEGGSEVLALAFLLLGAAYVEHPAAGLLFALAFLTRYLYALFIPFFLPFRVYRRNRRLLLYHLLGFFIPILLWSLWQYAVYGHPLASYIDFYYINGYTNGASLKFPRFDFLLTVTFPTIFLALLGVDAKHILFLLLALLLAALPDLQWRRFYVPVLIPAALSAIRWRGIRKCGIPLLLLNLLLAFFITYPTSLWSNEAVYADMAAHMDANCVYMSNVWVPLLCSGAEAIPPPSGPESYIRQLRGGYRAIILRGVKYPAYVLDESLYTENNIPVHDFGEYFVAGSVCNASAPSYRPDDPWEFYTTRLMLILRHIFQKE